MFGNLPFRIWPRLRAIPGLFRELLQFVEANAGLGRTFRGTTAEFSKLQYVTFFERCS